MSCHVDLCIKRRLGFGFTTIMRLVYIVLGMMCRLNLSIVKAWLHAIATRTTTASQVLQHDEKPSSKPLEPLRELNLICIMPRIKKSRLRSLCSSAHCIVDCVDHERRADDGFCDAEKPVANIVTNHVPLRRPSVHGISKKWPSPGQLKFQLTAPNSTRLCILHESSR